MQNFMETKEYLDLLTMLRREVKKVQLYTDLAIKNVSEAADNSSTFEVLGCQDWVIERLEAVLAAFLTKEVILLFWKIGKATLEHQEKLGWGSQVVEQLDQDLKHGFSELKGFAPRNFKYIRKFAEEYPDIQFVQQVAARLPWSYHLILMKKLKTPKERLFYIQKTIESGWSQNKLTIQIGSNLYGQQEKATSNFALPTVTLPTFEQLQRLCESFRFKDLFEGFKDDTQEE